MHDGVDAVEAKHWWNLDYGDKVQSLLAYEPYAYETCPSGKAQAPTEDTQISVPRCWVVPFLRFLLKGTGYVWRPPYWKIVHGYGTTVDVTKNARGCDTRCVASGVPPRRDTKLHDTRRDNKKKTYQTGITNDMYFLTQILCQPPVHSRQRVLPTCVK